MPVLIVQLGSKRHAVPLTGTAVVGRDLSTSLPIDHPTVSRRHARLGIDESGCWIEDLGSRNGTRVNGRLLRGRQPLHDGDRLRIGHVPCWYFEQAPEPSVVQSLNHRWSDGSGFSFRCECGVRLWADTVESARTLPCPACGSRSHADAATPAAELQSPGNEAAVCGVCQWPIRPGEVETACPSCHARYHAECWMENRGCSVYGCDQVNALQPETPNPAAPLVSDTTQANPPSVRPTSVQQSVGPALAAGSAVASILGLLLFGVPAALTLIVALMARRSTGPRWTVLSLLISVLGLVGGVVASGWWWLDWPLDAGMPR